MRTWLLSLYWSLYRLHSIAWILYFMAFIVGNHVEGELTVQLVNSAASLSIWIIDFLYGFSLMPFNRSLSLLFVYLTTCMTFKWFWIFLLLPFFKCVFVIPSLHDYTREAQYFSTATTFQSIFNSFGCSHELQEYQ